MIGERRRSDADSRAVPAFASAHPAASIIPHNVGASAVGELVAGSERIFEALLAVPGAGVRQQRHLKLFEVEDQVPPPPPGARELEVVDERSSDRFPRRPGVDRIFGHAFGCFFCNMPSYGPWLEATVERAGIPIVRRRLDPAALRELEGDLLVNCLGIGASTVFPEIGVGTVLRGILVESAFDLPPAEPIVSYNYTPRASELAYADGTSADVYFYPRDGHCILGGTREPVRWDPRTGQVESLLPLTGPTIRIDGVDVPRPLIELNSELIEQLTGRRPKAPFRATVGLRHLAGSEGAPGFELGLREHEGRPVIDAFGFGGAGVTLSWGAALRVVELCEPFLGGANRESEARIADLLGLLAPSPR